MWLDNKRVVGEMLQGMVRKRRGEKETHYGMRVGGQVEGLRWL